MTLLEALEDIEANVENLRGGICSGVWIRAGALATQQLKSLFKTWPEFSGDLTYPVPGYEGINAREAYWATEMASALWKGEYGAARLRLLQYCIKMLKKEMEHKNA